MSRVLSGPVCVLCVILLPAVCAVTCSSYTDKGGRYHASQKCYTRYCCGSCDKIYCCSDQYNSMSQSEQERCSERPMIFDGKKNIALIMGSILGSIFPIIFCVGLIVCCVAPCCLCYKKCRKRPRTSAMTVINVPQQPHSPSGYDPSYPGYQPVPAQPVPGGQPIPTAPPPSYSEATDPAYPPVAFSQGQPMYPFPHQPYAPPLHPHEPQLPLPYNPSYAQNPSTE